MGQAPSWVLAGPVPSPGCLARSVPSAVRRRSPSSMACPSPRRWKRPSEARSSTVVVSSTTTTPTANALHADTGGSWIDARARPDRCVGPDPDCDPDDRRQVGSLSLRSDRGVAARSDRGVRSSLLSLVNGLRDTTRPPTSRCRRSPRRLLSLELWLHGYDHRAGSEV
jgi:hypothetical protein